MVLIFRNKHDKSGKIMHTTNRFGTKGAPCDLIGKRDRRIASSKIKESWPARRSRRAPKRASKPFFTEKVFFPF